MHPRRGEGNQVVARGDTASIDDAIFLNDSDTESGQVKIPGLINTRHFGSFAAD